MTATLEQLDRQAPELMTIERGDFEQLVQCVNALRAEVRELAAQGQRQGQALATMTIDEVARHMRRAPATLRAKLSRDPGYWLHGCAVEGETCLFHTDLVMRHLSGARETISWE